MKKVKFPQDHITVNVGYYDEAEKTKFKKYPTNSKIDEIVSNPIQIPTAEFLTYYLFHNKRFNKSAFNNYQAIGSKLEKALSDLEDLVCFNGHSISTDPNVIQQSIKVSEYIGEAIGLAVISKIHELTKADWEPIKQTHGRKAVKTFDFEFDIASDGQIIIQVENKGSSVENNSVITSVIINHKHNIEQKKIKISQQTQYPFPASLRYGTITALDKRQDGQVQCWLVDPDAFLLDNNPRHYRILKRLSFFYNLIYLISPHSQLASVLATRIIDLINIRESSDLNGVKLQRNNGKEFEFIPFDFGYRHSTFFTNKCRISDGPAGGILFKVSNDILVFIGMQDEILTLVSDQNFDRILKYRNLSGSIEKQVECTLTKHRYSGFNLPQSIIKKQSEDNSYVHFILEGQIHYSSSGLVFGLLPIPNK